MEATGGSPLWAQKFLSFMDFLIHAAESIMVLLLALVSVCLMTWIIVSDPSDVEKAGPVLEKLKAAWPAVAAMLIPLFYRPIRIFMMEVQTVFGVSRRTPEVNQPKDQPETPSRERGL